MTTGVPAPLPILQFFNNAGAPNVGGSILTQVGGVNAATFQDVDLTIPLPNPIPLNSRGEISNASGLSCQLFLTPNVAYVFTMFDANGNQMNQAPYVNGVQFTPNSIGQLLYPQTAAEIAANITPTNYSYAPGDVRRYGGILDGATDCVAALVSACAVGGNITVPGPMALASASLAALTNSGIALVSGTKFFGIPGMPWTVTGTTPCQVFYSTDVSDIEFNDVFCNGNGVGTSTLGYFWYSKHTAAATQDANNHQFIRGGLANFAGYYWMYWDNTAAVSFAVKNVVIDDARFVSKPGNNQGPTLVTITASVCGFSGSDTVTGLYTVKDCIIRHCWADGTHIKSMVYFWSGTLRCKAYNNTLIGFGSDSSFSDDTGCYALAAYDHSHGTGLNPNEIDFFNNVVDVVRDCGVYVAVSQSTTSVVRIQGNMVSGQTSFANTTIPKGGIVVSGVQLPTITGNTLVDCAIGVSIVQNPDSTAVARLLSTNILSVPTNGFGVIISGSTGGNANDIGINGLTVDTQASGVTGIQVNATATVGINNLDLLAIDVHACANGIRFTAPDSSIPALGNIRFNGVKLRHITGQNLVFPGNCTNATQRLTFENLLFADMQAGAVGLLLAGAINVTARGITFCDMTSGATFCWYGGSATGRVSNIQYVNVAINNRYSGASNELGVVAPTFTGNDNDFISDLNPTELGSTSSKYTRQGWVWDRVNAAWKEVRALTGN